MKSMNVTETTDQQRNTVHNSAVNSCWSYKKNNKNSCYKYSLNENCDQQHYQGAKVWAMWSYLKIPNWFPEAQKYFAQIIRKAACTKLLRQSNYSKHTSFYTHFYNCSQVTGAKQACHIGACSQMLHQVPPLVLELLVVAPSLHHCSLQTAHQLIFQIQPEISFL